MRVSSSSMVSDLDISECISQILSSNFDAISAPALTVITKYLLNIASFPRDEKYQKINLENKVFCEKVATAKGSLNLLFALGFRMTSSSPNSGSSVLTWSWSSKCPDVSVLCGSVLDIMFQNLETLSVPLDGLQSMRAKVITPSLDAMTHSPTAVEPPTPSFTFDPYKANIIRKAPQVCCFVVVCCRCVNIVV
jgi:hypothetical protein